MVSLKATVKNGRLVLDEPTDLPDGTEIELVALDPEDDPALVAELEASLEDEKAGRTVPLAEVIASLGSRR